MAAAAERPELSDVLSALPRAIRAIEPSLAISRDGARAGRLRGDRFYPIASGVLCTRNRYPVSYLEPEEGVARIVFGLPGDLDARIDALRFVPAHPDVMPDFSTPRDVLRNAQRRFLAHTGGPEGPIAEHEIDDAIADGTLALAGGVVSLENDVVYPGIHRPGVRVVTFASLLRGTPVPLARILDAIVHALNERFPEEVRLYFALDLPTREETDPAVLALERLEPGAPSAGDPIPPDDPGLLVASADALGHGRPESVHDLVFVAPDRFDDQRTREIAEEVRAMTGRLHAAKRPYVLVTAGRLGSTERSLGLPLAWDDIRGAAVLVETALDRFNVETSRGMHFFREMIHAGCGHAHVTLSGAGDAVHWDRLARIEPAPEGQGRFAVHARAPRDLRVRLDAPRGEIALG